MRGRGPKEDQLHLSVAQLLDWILLPPAFYTTFPAGWGVLSPSMAQRLKKSGLKAGMPDILVFHHRCIGIELKTDKNRLSHEQRETRAKLQAAGVPVYVCRSIDQVLDVMLLEQIPIRRLQSWSQGASELLLAATSAKLGAEGGEKVGDTDGAASREAR